MFCTRYKRKIFICKDIEERLKELIQKKCNELEIDILSLECNKEYVHIYLSIPPTLSPSDIMQKIKKYTSRILREEFINLSSMPALWTRCYLVSSGELTDKEINDFIKTQKTRD